MAANLFFLVLPLDLQLCIVHTWLYADDDVRQLAALSAVDVACCCRSLRQQILEILGHPTFLAIYDSSVCQNITDFVCFVNWLFKRGIAVRTLWVTERSRAKFSIHNMCRMSTVEGLVLDIPYVCSYSSLYGVLYCCPNILFIALSQNGGHHAVVARVWLQLAYITPLVSRQAVMICVENSQFDQQCMRDMVKELNVLLTDDQEELTAPAVGHAGAFDGICHAACNGLPASGVTRLLRLCPNLTDLLVETAGSDVLEAVLELEQSRRRLVRFTQCSDRCSFIVCKLSASGVCRMNLLGLMKKVGLCLCKAHGLEDILSHCPHLELFYCCGAAGDCCLKTVARCCKNLKVLLLDNDKEQQIEHTLTDLGLQELFVSCPTLKVLWLGNAPKVTFHSLQAIIDCRLGLENLAWSIAGFGQRRVEKFRSKARKAKLIPVPVLERWAEIPAIWSMW